MYTFDPRRIQKLESLRLSGIEPFPKARTVSHTSADCRAAAQGLSAQELDASIQEFTIAGRMMAKNEMGRAGFAILSDRKGRLQIYVRKNVVGAEAFSLWKKLDLGDIIRVRGTLMKTRRGDLTLRVLELNLSAKCIRSLPDKWKGLTDIEFRHRHRYVDLLMNEETRRVFQVRAMVVRLLRSFFQERDFMEVETPMMHVIPGGATARPFITHHNALDMDLYLRIAPELFLKRLLVGGFERVFELNRNFRNEGLSPRHNPEFTMLEFYQANATYHDLMTLTEDLVTWLVKAVKGSLRFSFQGKELDCSTPWRRVSMGDLLIDATGLSQEQLLDPDALRARWMELHSDEDPAALPESMGLWWDWFFQELVEPGLVNPTFVTRFPVGISPLSRRCEDDPAFVDRFELFMGGQEIANAFTELNDPQDQAHRFARQAALRESGQDEAMFFDSDYIDALSYGMPPAAGEGLGVDRLVMLLTDQASIREVILFPTLRPRHGKSSREAEHPQPPSTDTPAPATRSRGS